MGGHIIKSFDRDLEKLDSMLSTMGEIVNNRFATVAKAIRDGNASQLDAYLDGDDTIDALDTEVDGFTLKLLALREPKALDLRMVISAQKIASDLERISDYCSSLMKQVERLHGVDVEPYRKLIEEMLRTGEAMLAQVAEAMAEKSVEKAMRVWHQDDELDEHYEKLIARLQHTLEADGGHLAYGPLLLVARYLERIGDHVTNIAEHIYFLVLGEKFPGHK